MKSLSAMTIAGIAAAAVVLAAQTQGIPERFTAMAVNMNRGGTARVDITVNRWSTEAERTRLLTTLREKGPEKLLEALQHMPRVGYIQSNGGLGYDLHYAHHVKGQDGGERVVIATDRRIGYWEAANQPRSIDYPFTIIELRLNADGEGEGKMSLATKITEDPDKQIITLENYELQPVLLQSVRRERVTQ
jgi:hypothetical protein